MLRAEQGETVYSGHEALEPDTLRPQPKNLPEESTPWGWLAALMIVAAGLRLVALDQQLWYDEIAMVVNSMHRPLRSILSQYTSQNQHTLYSILARGLIALFGEHPWVLRLPAVAFGVASVPALFFFARQVTSRSEALLACALMVFSYHQVWFSQNARGYTALLFFTLLSSCYFIRGLRENSSGLWLGYGLALALGMYTHLTMGFVAAGHALVYVWLLAGRARQPGQRVGDIARPVGGFALAGLLTLLLYAPLLPHLLARTVAPSGPAVHWEWKSPLWMIRETLRGLEASAGGKSVVIAFAGLVALAGLGSFWRKNRYAVGLMVLPCVVTAIAMFALEHNLWPRFFFFAIGSVFLLVVRGAAAIAEAAAQVTRRDTRAAARWAVALVVLLLAGSAVTLPAAYRYPKQDFLGAMRLVDIQRQPGEPVLTVGMTSFAYQRYFGRDWPPVETYAQLEAARAQGRRVWLVYAFPIYLKARYPEIWNAIQTDFRTVGVFRGTLGDGEIYVAQAGARSPTPLAAR